MEAADYYQAAHLNPHAADMKAVFLDAASVHEEFAALLAAYIRQHDDQPKLPDPDRETLELFFNSVRARLTGTEKQALIEGQAKIEQKLHEAIQPALECNLVPDIKQLLEEIQENAQSMLHLLRNQH